MKQTFWLALVLAIAGAKEGFPAQNFQLTTPQILTNHEMLVTLSTPSNVNYDILVTSNLTSWNSLATFLAAGASLQHTDSAAPFLDHRSYRGLAGTGTNAVTGDHLVTSDGDVVIHPRSHAEMFLQWRNSSNTVNILTDPTNKLYYYLKPDLILLTHGHQDHVNTTVLSNVLGANTRIIASPWANSNLTTSLKSITTVLTNTMSTNLLGVGIQAIAAYNTTKSNHPTNAGGVGYVLTFANKRLYISGDGEDTPEMRALRNIDVSFLTIHSASMNVSQAVSAVRAFVPKVVYPFHTAGTLPSDLASMKWQLMTNPAVEVRLRNWYGGP